MTVRTKAVIDLVDDDALVLRALERLLRSHGYLVRSFLSAEEFLVAWSDCPAKCLIFDVQMPGMSGLELFAKLRSAALNVPVIFITAHEDLHTQQLALNAGAVAFLHKPLRGRDLCIAIRSALEQGPRRY